MVKNKDGTVSCDEIETYRNAKYISASQAIGHIFELPICKIYPSVEQLALHLPNEQSVLIREGVPIEESLEKASETMLTRYFELNRTDPNARQYCYINILKHYSYNKQEKRFMRRKRNMLTCSEPTPDGPKSDQIGRLPMVSLNKNTSELFHLRLLLHHVPGPQSFEDLRTVNGEVLEKFQQATIKLGLWEDDSECELALSEAYNIKFGRAFIRCFVNIIIHCMPADPTSLYEKFKEELAEHLKKNARVPEATEEMHNSVLLEMKEMFKQSGEDMKKFDLPQPREDMDRVFEFEPQVLQNEIDFCQPDMLDHAIARIEGLFPDQRPVCDKLTKAVENNLGGVYVVNAPAGTGKTHLTNTILEYLRSKGHICIATAMSGIAGNLLENGRTLHFKLAVPIKTSNESMCRIKDNSAHAKLVQKASLLVIDEITMCHKTVLETVDRSLRHHRKCDRPCGGMTVLFTGDWRQCLPVVQGAGKAEILSQTVKASDVWKTHAQVYDLNINKRLINADEETLRFNEYLMKIGNGTETVYPIVGEDMVLIPKHLRSDAKNLKELSEEIFPNLKERVNTGLLNEGVAGHDEWKKWLTSRFIICPTNEDCTEVNDIVMKELDGQAHVCRSADKVLNSVDEHGKDRNNEVRYPTEFLNTLKSSSMPPHILILKPGCPIMLLRNLDPENGHCNGARYIVKRVSDRIIHAELCTGPHAGKDILLPRICFQPEDKNIPVEFQRRQFLVRPCFAITSNKSQGQTAEKVGVYLKNDMFGHGQLYVALSRVGHPDRIKIFKPVAEVKDKKEQGPSNAHLFMRNVVYKETLN